MNVEPDKVKLFITKYNQKKSALIGILQEIQAEYNYLPKKALLIVSRQLNIPLIDIMGVATFYSAFSLVPKGDHIIKVCLGTACHVRGGAKILDNFQKKLKTEAGQTTEDRQFSLDTVACLGCCAIGPVVVVDENYHAQTSIRNVESIINKYKKNENKNEESNQN